MVVSGNCVLPVSATCFDTVLDDAENITCIIVANMEAADPACANNDMSSPALIESVFEESVNSPVCPLATVIT